MPKVLAFDYDGTIARGGLLPETMRAALQAARHAGCALVLVTGRIYPELLRELPDVLALFDRVVLENGAVLVRPGGQPVPLAEPVDERFDRALLEQGVDTLRGQVHVALEARHEERAKRVVEELGLDVRMVRNRSALMVAPPSVSKASGLSHALASLGVSEGEAIAVGDAENDVTMISACALGVAVGDAVAELTSVADVVLEKPGPEGAAEFVFGLVAAARPGTSRDR
ncbi:MAG: HAD family phosphatase [Deltaproteobacteria bacterium]|nr:HAD family phosphatase [Deltaproteobacteria bacterium]